MTFAQYVGVDSSGHLTGGGIMGLINTVIVPVIFALSFLAFVWGVVNYFFLHGDNEGKREEGRSFILWGLIGLFVLFSVWGLVNVFLSTLGIAPQA
jgi:hypothetical protein